MKEIEKSSRLGKVHYAIRGPVLEEAGNMEERGIDIIRLNIGNPAAYGLHTPDTIMEAMTNRLHEAQGYSDSRGILEAREAIRSYNASKGIENVHVDDVFIGNGVSELILMAMQALLNEGDEMLIPAPDYPLWTSAVCLSGGKPVHYLCDEASGWYPDLKDLSGKIGSRTKGIVVINPNNPSGALYPVDILEKIADLARAHDLIVFSDEIYDRLVMDGKKHVSMAAVAPDLFTVVLSGLSKSHLATGFRSGWMCMCGNRAHARDFISGIRTLASLRLCSNVPAQTIIPAALAHADLTNGLYRPKGRIYEQRKLICDALNAIDGLSVNMPEAAFYLFPKIDVQQFNIASDEQFAYDLLRERHVLIVHGTGFHWPRPDHFRLVYLPDADRLTLAADRIREFLKNYRQKPHEKP
jgi:alanine-synthesizing transaminase